MTAAIADDQSLKATLEAQSSEEFEALQQAGFYYRMVGSLRINGLLNLILGGFTLSAGLF
nr:hypothetical protein [Anaerolineae bacterium]